MTVADEPAPAPPPAKKAKAAADITDPAAVLRASLLCPDSLADLAKAYAAAAPFPHAQLTAVFDPAVLRSAREEIVEHVQATYKETDLFKVFQTGDLGNLDALDPAAAAKLPALMSLKAALYSDTFRQAVRTITGCGDLAPTTDCSANVYARGGHLLTHDDVIGTRRVSWILYLTDPDEEWDVAADGGGLELFPLASPCAVGTPATEPTVTLPPSWNSLAMFTVQPGVSFHAVQEVVADGKPRLSISGWFHAPAAPDGGRTTASLAQLQLRRGEDCLTGHTPFGESTDADLSAADLEALAPWVNPAYLKPPAWEAVRARFTADGSVQLHRFLKADVAAKVVALIKAADAADGLGGWRMPSDATVGQRGQWAVRGPPHKQRHLRWEGGASDPATLTGSGGGEGTAPSDDASDAAAAAGAALAAIQDSLFLTPAFARLLRACTTVTQLAAAPDGPRRFRPGLDYTVAHFGAITAAPRLDAVLCFVDDAGEGDSDTSPWAAGDVGGFEAYILADEDVDDKGKAGGSSAAAAAAAVYRAADADDGVINAPAAANCLNLTLRDDGLMRFVKYVSAGAPGSRWDVAVEYLPEDDGEEDDEGEEGKAEE